MNQNEQMREALRKIMEAHRFNVSSMPTTEVHSLCFDALTAEPAPLVRLTDDECRGIFLKHGFTIKEGQTDLKQYVFAAANAIMDAMIAKNGGKHDK